MLRALQILAVARVQTGLREHLRQFGGIELLKRGFNYGRLAAFGQILGNRINKKQAQRLDATLKQLLLALKMVIYSALNNHALHLIGQHAKARRLAQRQAKAVGKEQLFSGNVFCHMPA